MSYTNYFVLINTQCTHISVYKYYVSTKIFKEPKHKKVEMNNVTQFSPHKTAKLLYQPATWLKCEDLC